MSSQGVPNHYKFIFGGLSGMGATLFVHPFDLLKNRMQLAGRNSTAKISFLGTIRNIATNEGVLHFYDGLSAGLLRQATYTTTRLGLYNAMLDHFSDPNGKPLSFATKTALGLTAGATAAMIGTPAEVALIRMSADGMAPVAERRGYKNVFDALIRIVREEGVLTLWRGCTPTVARAMVVNASQLATYTQGKEKLLQTGYFTDGILVHFMASMLAGLASATASLPVDIAKTRLQNMRWVNGVPEYSGMINVIGSIVQKEGVGSLWKGFLPYFSRLGPHTVITFIFVEQMSAAYLRLHHH
eukprot:m.232272 g.232272  ORF g.232272 m.232272 type:complete len:299 (-) comp18660_c0_seq1:37-933(-)